MGQKVNPTGLRLGITEEWKSTWFSDKDYVKYLNNDLKIRDYLDKALKGASVSNVVIDRTEERIDIKIHTAKPGVVIGQGGKEIEKLRNRIKRLTGETVYVTIIEVKNPNLDAQIVADSIAYQLENRGHFRNVQKRAIQDVMRSGAKGIKTSVSGRLGGADMARTEWFDEGSVPLHTLRADIDYAASEADTTYGKLGVKVWIYKGEVLPKAKEDKGGNSNVNAKED